MQSSLLGIDWFGSINMFSCSGEFVRDEEIQKCGFLLKKRKKNERKLEIKDLR